MFLVHGTDVAHLERIVHAGYLDPAISSKYRRMLSNNDKASRRICFQVLDKSTVPTRKRAVFWGSVILVFTPEILAHQQGTYGDLGSFDKSHVSRFSSSSRYSDTIDGAIKKIMNTTQTRGYDYMNSHELTLENRVDVGDAVAVLVMSPKYLRDVRTLVPLPVVIDASKMTYIQAISAIQRLRFNKL